MQTTLQTSVYEGLVGPESEKTYYHVPFEIPAGAVRLEVDFTYNDRIGSNPTLTGGNTVDLGVFDERGIDFLRAGFRGWSGSERDHFFITETEATPGYLAGPLNPGVWHVLLGLYKVAPQGCRYRVEVKVTTSPDASANKPLTGLLTSKGSLPASQPKMLNAPWLRGELHCHTLHSDGLLSAANLVERARQRGLDFLAVADHNTTASQLELAGLVDPGLILIRGVESTSYKGHFNIWGIPDWVDFRVQCAEDMKSALQYASERGGLTSCSHPKPFGPGWDYPEVNNHDCVEVWNGPWTGLNGVSLQYWLDLLATGRRIPAVGGSDFHREGESAGGNKRDLGTPTNWVYAAGDLNESGILESIRAGHVSLSDEPDGPLLVLRAGESSSILQGDSAPRPSNGRMRFRVECSRGIGSFLWLLDQTGKRLEREITSEMEIVDVELQVTESLYIRAELRTGEEWMRAMTNPIYLD